MGGDTQEALAIRMIVAFILALFINWFSFMVLGRPFLYCDMGGLFSTLYLSFGNVLLLAMTAYTAFMLFRRQNIPALDGVVIIIGIVELPRLAEYAFRLGGTCG